MSSKKTKKEKPKKNRSSKNLKISTRIILTAILGILIPIILIGAFSPLLIYFTGSYFNISSVTTNSYSTVNQIQWSQTISSISNSLLSDENDKKKIDSLSEFISPIERLGSSIYIEKNGKMSMGAVVEQMQQTYELQTNGYYSQLHLVEGYLLQKKELSLETEENRNFFEAWERESESTLLFLQENGKAITADGTKMRIDIPSKLLLDLRNGHNIAKLVAWNHEEIQNGAYLVAISCQPYRIDGKTYTAIGTAYNHAKLDSMLKLKGYHGNAYLFLLDNEGNITYTNQSKDVFFRNYSLLKHLRKSQAITEGEAETLQKRLADREQGVEL